MVTPLNPLSALSQSLLLLAASRGVPMERLLRAAGLQGDGLLNPETRLSESAVLASLRMMEQLHPAENIALALAGLLPTALFGQLRWFLMRSPDLSTFLHQLERHSDLINDRLIFRVERAGDEVSLVQHHPMDEEDGGLGVELCFACGRPAVRDAFGVDPLRVEFRHTPRGPRHRYTAVLGAPVVFGAPANRVVFTQTAVAAANQRAVRPALAEGTVRHLRAQLGHAEDDGLGDVHRAVTAAVAARSYGAQELAARLGTSLRALQRRLRRQGTSPNALLEEARHAEALRLLDETDWTVDHVAEVLGYASERGFRKAFERWTGRSPARYRRAGTAG